MGEGIEQSGGRKQNRDLVGRRSLPHPASREMPNRAIIQYITCTTKDRRRLLTRPEVVRVLESCWKRADRWLVGRYVVMPDHLHLFCAPRLWPPSSLGLWMEFWRSQATRFWPYPDERPIWQKDFFDRQLRSGESYFEKWMYLVQNPVEAGLVARWENWPYQGEINTLPWHEPT